MQKRQMKIKYAKSQYLAKGQIISQNGELLLITDVVELRDNLIMFELERLSKKNGAKLTTKLITSLNQNMTVLG
jgi:hypothetical protein